MSKDNGYKNVMIAGVWQTKNGHFNTKPLDAKAFDALQDVLEHGGKFLIRKRSEESMAKAANPETTPPYYLEFVPASEVIAYQEEMKKKDEARGI